MSRTKPPSPPDNPPPAGNGDSLRAWKRAAVVASIIIVLSLPLYMLKDRFARPAPSRVSTPVTFVGKERCIECHKDAYNEWLGSDHDHAMAEASDSTVLGDFNDAVFENRGVTSRFYRNDGKFFVRTEGPGGEMGDFEVAYVFGVEPLQQYLIPFPGGRLQSLTIAWDTERNEWFHLYPDQDIPADDWLHWTRGGQNWNGMCAECHSTNLKKGYDPATKTFTTTWSEIDVSCEACHGPGSRHVEWAGIQPMARPEVDDYALVVQTGGIDSRHQSELCAPCHSRRTQFGDYDHTSTGLLENLVPALLQEGLYFADGQILEEVYVYGSFVQSKMHRNNVRCSNCHDAHSLKLVKEGNDLCLQCHKADTYDTYDHHFHKKIHEGKTSDGALCVKCHMSERPYMVIDWRADHSMRVPRPDLTQEIGTPNACAQSGCHNDKPVEWALQHFTDWYGRARKPHYGRTLHAGRTGSPGAQEALVKLAGDLLYPAIVRATALSQLNSYPGVEATAALAAAVSDEDPLVRYTAVQSVNVTRAEELVELVAPLLFDPSKAVRGQAAARLAGVSADLLQPYQREGLRAAIAEHTEAMEYALDFPFAGYNLGNLCVALGKLEEAESYYRLAIEIDDLFYPAKTNLAILQNSVGKNAEAEKLLREVVEDYPDRYEVAYSLALLLAEMDKVEESTEFLERAARGMPDVPRVHYNLGLAQQVLKRDAAAEAALSRAVALEPANRDYLVALVDHYMKRERPTEALPYVERLIEAYPHDRLGHDLKRMIDQSLNLQQ
jgi:predicted CXXCH cytochrome family protein